MSVKQLQLADFLGARCAVNVAGAFGPHWDGGYKENFSDEAGCKSISELDSSALKFI